MRLSSDKKENESAFNNVSLHEKSNIPFKVDLSKKINIDILCRYDKNHWVCMDVELCATHSLKTSRLVFLDNDVQVDHKKNGQSPLSAWDFNLQRYQLFLEWRSASRHLTKFLPDILRQAPLVSVWRDCLAKPPNRKLPNCTAELEVRFLSNELSNTADLQSHPESVAFVTLPPTPAPALSPAYTPA